MAQPVADPRSQYAGMSRGKAMGVELAASAVGGALSFAGSYGTKSLPDTMDRSLLTNRISQYTGGTGSYSQQQGVGVAATRAGFANQGFADVTGALGAAAGVGGGGANNAVRAVGAANWISQANPNLSLTQAVQAQNQITGVRSQNMLRGMGVNAAGQGSAKVSSQANIDGYIQSYERAAGHKLSSAEIESGNTPGYPLYRSIVATFGDPSVIPIVLNRWHMKNGTATASQNANNLTTTAQGTAAAKGNLATAANPGVVKGQGAFLQMQKAAANAATGAIQAGGTAAQDAIATAVGIGMAVDSLKGIAGTLGRIEKILLGGGAAKGAGGLLRRALGRGAGVGGGAGGAGLAGTLGMDVGAAGAGAIGATVVGGLAGGLAIGTAANYGLNKLGVGSNEFGHLLNSGNESKRNKQALQNLDHMVQSKGLMNRPGFDKIAYQTALAKGDWSGAMKVVQHATAASNSSYGVKGSGGAAGPGSGGGAGVGGAAVPPPSGAIGQAISAASAYIGKPYRSGGSNPGTGFDCAGLIQYAYSKVGIKLPNTAGEMAKMGQAVSASQARAGDLIFMSGSGPGGGHVGMYLGNGQMLDSPATGGTIRVSQANLASAVSIRRVATGGGRGGATAVASGGIGTNPDAVLMQSLAGGAAARSYIVASKSSGAGSANSNAAPTSSGVGAGAVASAPAAGGGGSNVALSQKMAAAMGWTGGQWNDLYAVWNQESSFKTTAGSPGHAYGIPQGNPGSVMASAGPDWQSNPATQIKWGLNYIRSRYGSPSGALAHKHSTDSNLGATGKYAQPGGWYEKGSWNIVKDQIASLHKGEMVLPEKTANMVRTMVGGDTSRGTPRGVSSRPVSLSLTYVLQAPTSEAEVRKHALSTARVLQDEHQIDLVAAGGASR
jgi:cell wall-associated NlpC family hydrolase